MLQSYDGDFGSILSAITNAHPEADSPTWSQAFLLVKFGGLDVINAVQLFHPWPS